MYFWDIGICDFYFNFFQGSLLMNGIDVYGDFTLYFIYNSIYILEILYCVFYRDKLYGFVIDYYGYFLRFYNIFFIFIIYSGVYGVVLWQFLGFLCCILIFSFIL